MGVVSTSWADPRAAEKTARTRPAVVPAARAHGRKGGTHHHPAVWPFRILLLAPFVLMGPEIVSAVLGRPGSVGRISASTADVLGTSAFLMLATMLVVTPLHTLTGWRWHLVLRRDYGVAMFATAAFDLILAASTTGNTFPGGVLTRVAGHTFLAAGTLSVLLLVPLALTAHRRAHRWLGRHWKCVHRLTYFVWGTVLLHLLLLFGLRSFFLDAVLISSPLVTLRIPAVRQWLASARRAGTHLWARRTTMALTAGLLVVGYAPFLHELARVGVAAFLQHPAQD